MGLKYLGITYISQQKYKKNPLYGKRRKNIFMQEFAMFFAKRFNNYVDLSTLLDRTTFSLGRFGDLSKSYLL